MGRRWDHFVQDLLGVAPPADFEVHEDKEGAHAAALGCDLSTRDSGADNFPLTREYYVLDHTLHAPLIFQFLISVRVRSHQQLTARFATAIWLSNRTTCRLVSISNRVTCNGSQSTSAIAQRRPQSRANRRGRCETRQHRSQIRKPSVGRTTWTPAPHPQLQRKNACLNPRLPSSKWRSAGRRFDVFAPKRASIVWSTLRLAQSC